MIYTTKDGLKLKLGIEPWKKWPDFAPISFHRQQVGIPPVDVSIGTTHQKWWCRLKSGVGLVIDCNYILEHSVHHYHNLLQEMYITHILILTDSIGSVHSHQNHLSDTPWCRFCRFNHHHDCCFKCINAIAGWWFGTWLLFFHILGMSSSQLTFIFFRGVGQPPTRLHINHI